MWLGWPGTVVILRANSGNQNSCNTSFESNRTDNGLPTGMWISFAVTAPDAGYCASHQNWCPVTTKSGEGAGGGSARFIPRRVNTKRNTTIRNGITVQVI